MVTRAPGKTLVIGNFRGRSNIVKALQSTEFRITEATECIRGLKHIIDETPNIIIIHQGKSIADTIKLVRAVRCLTSAPIIVVGLGTEADIVQSWLNGADAYLPRLFDVEALLVHLHVLLSQN